MNPVLLSKEIQKCTEFTPFPGILLSNDVLIVLSGSSIPSAFVLWVMRELPPLITANIREEPTTLTFVSDGSTTLEHPQSWTTAMSLQNQV